MLFANVAFESQVKGQDNDFVEGNYQNQRLTQKQIQEPENWLLKQYLKIQVTLTIHTVMVKL
jgi:hypothetical protein